MAYQAHQITLQSPIKVRIDRTFKGVTERRVIDCTLGKLIFNENIPQDLGFKPRESMDDMFKLEIDKEVVKKDLGNIVERCFRVHGVNICAQVLDNIKEYLGLDMVTTDCHILDKLCLLTQEHQQPAEG